MTARVPGPRVVGEEGTPVVVGQPAPELGRDGAQPVDGGAPVAGLGDGPLDVRHARPTRRSSRVVQPGDAGRRRHGRCGRQHVVRRHGVVPRRPSAACGPAGRPRSRRRPWSGRCRPGAGRRRGARRSTGRGADRRRPARRGPSRCRPWRRWRARRRGRRSWRRWSSRRRGAPPAGRRGGRRRRRRPADGRGGRWRGTRRRCGAGPRRSRRRRGGGRSPAAAPAGRGAGGPSGRSARGRGGTRSCRWPGTLSRWRSSAVEYAVPRPVTGEGSTSSTRKREESPVTRCEAVSAPPAPAPITTTQQSPSPPCIEPTP